MDNCGYWIVIVILIVIILYQCSSGSEGFFSKKKEGVCTRCINNPNYQKWKEEHPGINNP